MKPGDLVKISCSAGYGYAYHPPTSPENMERPARKPPVIIQDGTLLLYIGPDDLEAHIRMQPMVHVIHQGSLLTIDGRFLAPMQVEDTMV